MPRIEPVPIDQLEPDVRERLEAAVASGAIGSSTMSQITAYHPVMLRMQTMAMSGGPASMGILLEPRLLELLRLRSGQLGGCAECAATRYGDSVDEAEVECLVIGAYDDLSSRERIAVRYMELMHTDHHAIDDDFYRELAKEFSTAEIVELGFYVAQSVGIHRLMSTWDLLGTDPPAIPYDPAAIQAQETATSS